MKAHQGSLKQGIVLDQGSLDPLNSLAHLRVL